MDPAELANQVRQEPFQPLRVHLADGRVFEVHTRELIFVGKTDVKIGIQAANEPEGIFETVVKVPMEEVRRVEPLATPASPASR